MLGAGALGRPRGMVWGGWEGGGFRMGSMCISEIKKKKKKYKNNNRKVILILEESIKPLYLHQSFPNLV